MKTCTKCLQEKDEEQFHLQNSARTRPGYRRSTCKTCDAKATIEWQKNNPDKVKVIKRKTKIRKKYELSLEEYEKKVEEQKGVCAICELPHERRALNIDHCHTTGKIRGLLCDKCNMALGLVSDSVPRLKAMLNYLEKYN